MQTENTALQESLTAHHAKRRLALDALDITEKTWKAYSIGRRNQLSLVVRDLTKQLLELREIEEDGTCGTVRLVMVKRQIDEMALTLQKKASLVVDIESTSKFVALKLYEARLASANVTTLAPALASLVSDVIALDPAAFVEVSRWEDTIARHEKTFRLAQCPNAHL